MIARVWHGAVPEAKADAYEAYLLRTGIRDYRASAGNFGVHMLKRNENGAVHFTLVTFWRSLEALRRFAGDDVEKARYYPEDADFLVELEPRVTHHQVIPSPASGSDVGQGGRPIWRSTQR